VLSLLAGARGGAVGASGAVDSQGDLNNALYGYSACGSAHSGHAGSSAAQWVSNGWMATFNPVPSLVADVHFGLLMLGPNDVGDDPVAAANIGTLSDQFLVLHPQAIVFVANRLPRSFAATALWNAAVAAGVASRRAAGKNVVLVDLYSVVQLADLYDGLHPNAAANFRIADRWYGAMAPYLRA
jgi:hypothetical protein